MLLLNQMIAKKEKRCFWFYINCDCDDDDDDDDDDDEENYAQCIHPVSLLQQTSFALCLTSLCNQLQKSKICIIDSHFAFLLLVLLTFMIISLV